MEGLNWRALVVVLCALNTISVLSLGVEGRDLDKIITIPMPQPPPGGPKHNNYMCTRVQLAPVDRYIVRYEPLADPRLVHHMLLFGCSGKLKGPTSWSCKSSAGACHGSESKILFAWALNASGLQMPADVGMKIGPSARVGTLVIQIHYGHPETVLDMDSTSKQSLSLHTTNRSPRYVAGIYLLGSFSSISSGQEQVFADTACEFLGPKPIHPFAFRTHAHSLGEQIVGYIVKKSGEWQLIGTRSPQDAQAFYPAADDSLRVDEGDWLAARCVFNTKKKTHTISMGPDSEDEMCNFYIMYYTLNDGRALFSDYCWAGSLQGLSFPDQLPPLPAVTNPVEEDHDHAHSHGGGNNEQEDNDDQHTVEGNKHEKDGDDYICPESIPPGDPSLCPKTPSPIPTRTTPTTPPSTTHFIEGADSLDPVDLGLVKAEDWLLNDVSIPGNTLGQVSAVAVDKDGGVHILHRGQVVWDSRSFAMDNTYRLKHQGPIAEPTLLQFSSTGTPAQAWGEGIFYLPHGLTIDSFGSFWITDVALHQVFKFAKLGDVSPVMVLGIEFKPGSKFGHFCKPTSVAVETSRDFYVADGYCNERVLKFDGSGLLLDTWETPIKSTPLFIPHKLSLSSDERTLYLADRENQRVISYETSTGAAEVFSTLSNSVYAVSVNPSGMYGVFGGMAGSLGFTLDSTGTLVTTWGPKNGFTQPHDLAFDPVSGAVYVTEIGPNRIWKFVSLRGKYVNPLPHDTPLPSTTQPLTSHVDDITDGLPISSTDQSTTGSSPHSSQVTTHTSPSTNPPQSTSVSSPNHTYEGPVGGVVTADHAPSDVNLSTVTDAENIANVDGGPDDTVIKQATFNAGIFIAIFVLVAIVLIAIFGILREHKYLKRLRLYVQSKRKSNAPVEGGGITVEMRGKLPKRSLQSLLGRSQLGFSRLKTYDSDSEAEEFPVFNRV